MNQRNRSIFLAVAAMVVLACACPGMSNLSDNNQPPATFAPISTIPPVQTIVPQVPLETILFSDDFSVDTGEWENYADEIDGSAGVKNGVYAVRSLSQLWVWGRGDTEFRDTIVEFDAAIVSGPSNGNAGVGVYCRLNLRDDTSINGYLLAISPDGYYAIIEFISGSPNPLVNWTASDAIKSGSAFNKIRASCNGNQLSLTVNGEELSSATIPDGGATSGYLAFATISFEDTDPIAESHFDNLVVISP